MIILGLSRQMSQRPAPSSPNEMITMLGRIKLTQPGLLGQSYAPSEITGSILGLASYLS